MIQSSYKVCNNWKICNNNTCNKIHPYINDIVICYNFINTNNCYYKDNCYFLHINKNTFNDFNLNNEIYSKRRRYEYSNKRKYECSNKRKYECSNKRKYECSKLNIIATELFKLKFTFQLVLNEIKKKYITNKLFINLQNKLVTSRYKRLFNNVLDELNL